MKIVIWLLGSLLAIAILFAGLQWVASERVEVVDLHTLNESGEEMVTRLWIVDDEGFSYLRVGADSSGWFSRLQANGEFNVTRNGETATYTAVLREDKSEHINSLMQDKYTWGDTIIGYMFGSRDGSVPVELHRVD
ncbi:MAG: hypothetical protein JKY98_09590 [Gammaproteobacteria bacterium]|nr:hypothetical protein [Gammaproteobacteria bacterium]